jgi:hypothetical protein
MSTLHLLGEAAVRRDLHRARVVLSSASPLRSDRRVPLCNHLVRMTELVGTAEPVVHQSAQALRDAAALFREDPGRSLRTEVLGALGSLHRATVRRTGWIDHRALPYLRANAPWLLDGVAGHAGAGLVPDAEDRMRARERLEQYRRWRLELWGPAVLDSGVLVR